MDTIIITGVGKGFGRDLAEHFAKSFRVIGLSRSPEDLKMLSKDLGKNSDNCILEAVDLSDFSAVQRTLVPLIDAYQESLVGLINNAGVRCRKSFLDLSISEIKSVSDINLFSPIYLSRLVLPSFISNRHGRIINISSILSKNALPDLSAYTVSKAGLDGFTRSVAVEYGAYGVTCNSILPGFCKTSYYPKFAEDQELLKMTLDKTPAKRWGESSELIGICELLIGEGGGFINGASIPVDGGWLA